MARILIVEGASATRRLAAESLARDGHEVIESSRGAGGLKLAVTERPDLILVDTLLPDMDGAQFVRALRSIPNGDRPQVVFRAPACIDAEARVLATDQTGFFVAKGPDAASLCAVVNEALDTPRREPVEQPSAPGPNDGLWRRLTRKLNSRSEQLERHIADLQLHLKKSEKQLKVARAAVDREIKKRLWAEQELARANLLHKDQTMHDMATGIHNRRYLEQSLHREESRAQRSGEAFGVVMIDIDDLKHVNNTLGHAAGDAVLLALGGQLQSLVRGEDIVARFGGDEFALVMTQCPQHIILARAEKLREEASRLIIKYKGEPIDGVTLSVGIGTFPEHGISGQEVIQAAGKALNLAKRRGRNRTVVGESEAGATPDPATRAGVKSARNPRVPQE